MSQATATRAVPKEPIAIRTATSVIHPVLACLLKAEQEIGPGRVWSGVNDEQARFLSDFFHKMEEVAKYRPEELKSILSMDAAVINRFLADHGFKIELDPFRPNEFGVAAVLNVLVEWLSPGAVGELDLPGRGKFPSVHLKGEQGVRVLEDATSGRRAPIVSIYTKSGDLVHMTVAESPCEGFELTARVQYLREAIAAGRFGVKDTFDGAVFPMILLDQVVDISWILGMSTIDTREVPVVIAQAKQQTKFRMNERGARAESAVAMGMERLCIPTRRKPFIIDRPFVCWIERPGLVIPIFSGVFAEDVWQNPGTLD